METFAKPENAPKRAEELINVGQKQAALQAIHDLHFKEVQAMTEDPRKDYAKLCEAAGLPRMA